MENPQAQMPQGQPGMEQGQAPQQGGQDQQMQQLMQAVQQMIQQGAQPVDVAAELLGQQVPPEAIMQVFVELGLPEQEAQMAIEQAMQGGQQPQGQGEEQMEGAASNPQEEAAEGQGAPMMPPGMEGQPPMRFGGQPRRMLRQRAEGGGMDPQQELQAVMQQVQGMMEQGADARQVMEKIEAAAQQGQISPEVATQVMEQLSGMQETANPQGSDVAMTDGSQDPQVPTPGVATPESNMMKFGGNLKKLMQKAYGGNAIPPSLDSKNYAQERANMFVSSVKNNAFKSSLDDEFPSLGGNQMAYGGNLPKANNGYNVQDYKSADEAELAARRYYDSLDAEQKKTFDWKAESGKWKEPEMKYEAGKSYQLDPASGKLKVVENTNQFQFQEGDILNRDAQGAYVTRKDGSMMRVPGSFNQGSPYNVSQSQINPVGYQDPRGNSLYDNLYMSAGPLARLLAGSGNRGYDPRIVGANLPGGMSGAEFLGRAGNLGDLKTGMTGTIGDQTWRVTGQERFKEGSIWKGNRRKGVRYNIDWGSASAMNPNTNQPQTNTTPQIGANNNPVTPYPGYVDSSGVNPAPAGTGFTTDAQGNQIAISPDEVARRNSAWQFQGNQVPNAPSFFPQNTNSVANANQTLVNPANSNVVQPGSEVNSGDNSKANMTVTNVTDTGGTRGVDAQGRLVSTEPDETQRRDKWDRRSDRQLRREEKNIEFPTPFHKLGYNFNKVDNSFEEESTMENNKYLGQYANPEDYFKDGNTKANIRNYYKEAFPNLPNKDRRELINYAQESNKIVTGIENRPEDAAVYYNIPDNPTKQELRREARSLKRENRQAARAFRNIANDAADQSTMPQVMQDAFQQQAYGGIVNRYDNGGSTVPGDDPKSRYAPYSDAASWYVGNIVETGERPPSLIDDPKFRPVMSPRDLRDEPVFGSQEEATAYMQNPANGITVSQWKNPQTGAAGQVQSRMYLDMNNLSDAGGGNLEIMGQGWSPGTSDRQKRKALEVAGTPQFTYDVSPSIIADTRSYGGSINPQDLANAVALINRAFGGMIPRADNGLNVTSWDKDGNGIPDSIQSNPLGSSGKGTLEASEGKKFKVDWNAAADVYATKGAQFANFMDKVSSFEGNQERELAKRSALNRPFDDYSTMDQGVYDQWGNFKPNDLNNQTLNPTDVYRQNQNRVYAYGGKLYEIGGEVELDDSELEALRMAGFNFRRS